MSRASLRLALLLGCVLGATLLVPSGASAAAHLKDLWCTSSTACLAVGASDAQGEEAGSSQVHAKRWDGSAWTAEELPVPEYAVTSALEGVACFSAWVTPCTAVGSYADSEEEATLALALRWDGTDWEIQKVPKPSGALGAKLADVACTFENTCIAVGSYTDAEEVRKSLIMRWDGSTWSQLSVPIPSGAGLSELQGISCTAYNDCVAVGSFVNSAEVTKTLALVWNGSSWSISSTPEPSGAELSQLYDVSCRPSDACTAVGTYFDSTGDQKTLALRRNTAKEWSIQWTPNKANALSRALTSVSCVSGTTCVSVGIVEQGRREIPIALWWNGMVWAEQTIDTESLGATVVKPEGVFCTSYTICDAVGAVSYGRSAALRNLAFHRDGSTWSVSEAGGYERKWLRLDASQATRQLNGVSCPQASTCFAVGGAMSDAGALGAQVASWGGEDWSVKAAPAPEGAEASELKAVSCASASSCKAAGLYTEAEGAELPLALSFNGAEWVTQAAPLPEGAKGGELAAVHCFASDACTAVGSYADAEDVRMPFAVTWNGTSWAPASVPAPEGAAEGWLTAVTCTAATACLAVGAQRDTFGHETGFSVKREGGTWSELATAEIEGNPRVMLRGIACPAEEECLAVGGYEGENGARNLAMAWTGEGWERLLDPAPQGQTEGLGAISCPSAEDCLVVGIRPGTSSQPPLIARSGTGTWLAEPPAEYAAGASAISLAAIDCHSEERCAAVGSASYGGFPAKSFALAYEQGVWAAPYFPAPGGGLRGVSCPDGESCIAVGDSIEPGGDPARAWTMSDGGWESAPTASVSGAFLTDVSCTASDQCTAIGRQSAWPFKPLAERFDGEEWVTQSVPVPSGRSSSPEAISCPTASFCVAVGFSWAANGGSPESALVQSWNGTAWSTTSPTLPGAAVSSFLHDVACTSASHCRAVGSYIDSAGLSHGLVLTWNGSSWSSGSLSPASGYGQALRGVDCVSSSNCAAVGTSTLLETNARAPLAYRWNGSSWASSSVPLPDGATGGALRSVDCYSTSRCAAVGVASDPADENPYIVGWQGSEWKLEPAPHVGASPNTALESLSCFSAADCTAVGIAQFADGPREMLVVQTEGEDPESDDPVAVAGTGRPKLSASQKEEVESILAEDPDLQAAIGAAEYEPLIGAWTEVDEETGDATLVGAFVEIILEEPESWAERTWPAAEYELGANGYEGGTFTETDFEASASTVETLQVNLDLAFDEELIPIEGEVVAIAPLPDGSGEVEINPQSFGEYDPAVAGY